MADRGIVSKIRAHLDGRLSTARRKRRLERALRCDGFSVSEAKKAVSLMFKEEGAAKDETGSSDA